MSELIGKVKVQQWEYLVEQRYSNVKEHEAFDELAYLKERGNAGWELVSVPSWTIPKYYFKRPLP